jgi:hypothetical protein
MAEVMTLKRAQRKQAKLKLGMSAPSGGGKTLGALFIAFGLIPAASNSASVVMRISSAPKDAGALTTALEISAETRSVEKNLNVIPFPFFIFFTPLFSATRDE